MNRKALPIIAFCMLLSLGFSFLPGPTTTSLAPTPTPTAIPNQYKWDLEAIYPDTTAWEKDFTTVKETYVPQYKNYEGQLGSADKLVEFFKMDDEASRIMEKMYVYAYMKSDGDQTNSQYTEMASRADSLYTDMGSAYSFFKSELIALPHDTLQGFMKDSRLTQYQHLFDLLLKQKAHTLNKEEEKLLADAGELASAPEKISTKIRVADLQFPKIKDKSGKEIQLSEDQYGVLMENPDRDLRKLAFEGVMQAYDHSKNSLAAALDFQVRKDIFFAKARKYNNSVEASLGDGFIPQEVFYSLIQATDNNLASLQRYISLRKKVLNLDKIYPYDMFISLVSSFQKTIPYEDGKVIVAQALAPLGTDYITNLETGFNNRWIDVYPSPHKNSGAYAWGGYDTHPYILLNYTNDISSVLDTAHEMGHAMNSYYTNKTQPFTYSSGTISIFTAEVASTTNEMLTLNYLLANAKDDNEKLYYLDKMAENIRGTFFLQVLYSEFEKAIHDRVEKGDALSVDSLNQMWGDLLVKYYGPDYVVNDQVKEVWMRIPHFYYNFYVYQYATGLAASNQFATDILNKKPGAVDSYLGFLSAGSSDYPVDILKKAGVDMTSSKPVDNLISDFNNILDQMEAILIKQGKIKK